MGLPGQAALYLPCIPPISPLHLPYISPVLRCQAVGGAMADLLYGATPPTGKLAETWPLQLGDCASTRNFAPQHSRRQVVYLGVRVRARVRVRVRVRVR